MFEKPKHRTSAKKSYSGADQRERSPTLKASERKEGAAKTVRAQIQHHNPITWSCGFGVCPAGS